MAKKTTKKTDTDASKDQAAEVTKGKKPATTKVKKTKAAKDTSKPATKAAPKKSTTATARESASSATKAASGEKAPKKSTASKATGTTRKAATTKKTTAKAAAEPKVKKVSAAKETPTSATTKKTKAASAKLPSVSVEEMRDHELADRELPLEYGETKVVLMVRDPEWIFAYWEIDNKTRKHFRIPRGKHNRLLALRVIELDQNDDMVNTYDVGINDHTASWYVKIDNPNHRYIVELGILDVEGGFEVITTSNEVTVPRRTIAEASDVEFAEISDEVYNQLVHLSGGTRIRERLGSDEFLRSLQERVTVSLGDGGLFSGSLSSADILGGSSGLYGLSSALFSGSLSSGLLSSALFSAMLPGAGGEGALKDTVESRQGSEFWLEVGVDVIVYGATTPDAKVKLMGQEIDLNPDGTFRLRMVLPDTSIEFPVEAVSADGEHKRAVKPVVVRYTEGDPRKPL